MLQVVGGFWDMEEQKVVKPNPAKKAGRWVQFLVCKNNFFSCISSQFCIIFVIEPVSTI